MSKDIVIITAVFPPEPVVSAQLSYDLALELSKDYSIVVVCPRPSRPIGFDFKNTIVDFPFNVHIVDSFKYPEFGFIGRMRESWSFGLKCKHYIKANYTKIDKIYMNAWPLFAQYIIVKTAKAFKIKIITHIQDIYPESLSNKLPAKLKKIINWVLMPLDKYILKNSQHIIAISQSMKDILSTTRTIKEEKIAVVNNWQDEASFTNFLINHKGTSSSGKFIFMYLGNIGPVAGTELLIESFAEACIPDSQLIIAGSGSRKDPCLSLALKYPNADIEFCDVPSGKVPEIQSIANVMLLPVKKGSGNNSIPSKLPAYMFSQKPIISCIDKDSSTAAAILEADCGWVVEPENKLQLIRAMLVAVNQKQEILIQKGNNGFNYALKNLSKSANLDKITSIIKQ